MTESLQEHLKSRVHYDPETGIMKYIINIPSAKVRIGDVSGTIISGNRRTVSFKGRPYPIGRLIVLYMDGFMPKFTGLHDGHIENQRYDNIFPCEKKIIYVNKDTINGNKKNIHPDRESIIDIIDLLDGKPRTLSYLIEQSKHSEELTLKIIKLLIFGGQVVLDRVDGCYSLTAKGHCRILTNKDELAKAKMDLHLKFYDVLHDTMRKYCNNVPLPLNHNHRLHV